MSKNDVRLKAIVVDSLPNYQFKIELEDGKIVRAYTAGKIRINNIRIIVGDSVEVVKPEKGDIYRIMFRL